MSFFFSLCIQLSTCLSILYSFSIRLWMGLFTCVSIIRTTEIKGWPFFQEINNLFWWKIIWWIYIHEQKRSAETVSKQSPINSNGVLITPYIDNKGELNSPESSRTKLHFPHCLAEKDRIRVLRVVEGGEGQLLQVFLLNSAVPTAASHFSTEHHSRHRLVRYNVPSNHIRETTLNL